jgi:hypothetical protein
MAKVEEFKKTAEDAMPKVRCHPCRRRDEQTSYAAASKEVHQLNEAAKARGVENMQHSH